MQNKTKKILITGASGFIGSHLSDAFKEKYQIYCHDIESLNMLNFSEVTKYLKDMNFDVIIHTATWSDSRISTNTPNDVFANNLNMFFNLARNHEYFGKLIYYGSGAEYDHNHFPPRVAEDYFGLHIPNTPYSLSKYIMAHHTLVSANIYELIPFSVFGPRENWRVRFISNACCRDIFSLPIFIMKNIIFDYIYIDDLVKITEWFIHNTSPERRYNICSSKPYDLYSLAEMIQKYSGKKNKIMIREEGMGREYSGDNSKLLNLLDGFQFIKMEQAIENIYQWYLNNKELINKDELFFDSMKK